MPVRPLCRLRRSHFTPFTFMQLFAVLIASYYVTGETDHTLFPHVPRLYGLRCTLRCDAVAPYVVR